MITIALAVALLVAALLSCLLLMDRQERRHQEERRELYQRIQAPQAAVIERQIEKAQPAQQPIMPLDDAQAAERQEFIDQLERMEREGIQWR